MTGLGDAELLDVWERAAGVPPGARGAELVDAGRPATLAETARRAAAVYADTFGAAAEVLLTCPGCGDTLELSLDLAVVAEAGPGPAVRTVPSGGGDLTVRALEVGDLVAAARAVDAVAELLRRTVTRTGAPVTPADLQPDDLQAVDDAARALAGAAATTVRTTCPTCGGVPVAGVDVVELLWDAVDRRARALLAQVATLAARLGWSEPEVLALSPHRRRAYLELVGA